MGVTFSTSNISVFCLKSDLPRSGPVTDSEEIPYHCKLETIYWWYCNYMLFIVTERLHFWQEFHQKPTTRCISCSSANFSTYWSVVYKPRIKRLCIASTWREREVSTPGSYLQTRIVPALTRTHIAPYQRAAWRMWTTPIATHWLLNMATLNSVQLPRQNLIFLLRS
jgi:hypothetical protein